MLYGSIILTVTMIVALSCKLRAFISKVRSPQKYSRVSMTKSGIDLRTNEVDGALEAHLPPFKPFRIAFDADRLRFAHKERVVQAIGTCDLVFDLTAGLGRDSVVLAAAGRKVVMVERNEQLFRLLQDGIRRLNITAPKIAQRVHLLHADSTIISPSGLLQTGLSHFNLHMSSHPPPKINVYLDPMYPTAAGDRRAKSRKETQILQLLTHSPDDDSSNSRDEQLAREEVLLFQAACGLSNGRVVVKRGLKDPPLRIPSGSDDDKEQYLQPHSTVEGSTQRFDLYFFDRLRISSASQSA